MKQLPAILLSGFLALLVGCASTKTAESTGEYLDNSMITSKVKTALFRDEGIASSRINVKTFKGVVQLSGFVNSKKEAERAVKVSAAVSNVKQVRNHLIVKG